MAFIFDVRWCCNMCVFFVFCFHFVKFVHETQFKQFAFSMHRYSFNETKYKFTASNSTYYYKCGCMARTHAHSDSELHALNTICHCWIIFNTLYIVFKSNQSLIYNGNRQELVSSKFATNSILFGCCCCFCCWTLFLSLVCSVLFPFQMKRKRHTVFNKTIVFLWNKFQFNLNFNRPIMIQCRNKWKTSISLYGSTYPSVFVSVILFYFHFFSGIFSSLNTHAHAHTHTHRHCSTEFANNNSVAEHYQTSKNRYAYVKRTYQVWVVGWLVFFLSRIVVIAFSLCALCLC